MYSGGATESNIRVWNSCTVCSIGFMRHVMVLGLSDYVYYTMPLLILLQWKAVFVAETFYNNPYDTNPRVNKWVRWMAHTKAVSAVSHCAALCSLPGRKGEIEPYICLLILRC